MNDDVTAVSKTERPVPAEDLSLEDLTRDPYPIYRCLRHDAPVCWIPQLQRWLVTGWAEAVAVESDPETFSARETDSLMTRVMGTTMLREDGEQHRRLRSACTSPLKPRAVDEWMPAFDAVANELIDGFAAVGEVELVSEFADPFATRTLAFVMGFEEHEADVRLAGWCRDLIGGADNYADDDGVWKRAATAATEVRELCERTIERTRSHPDGSLISSMAHADVVPPLAVEEIVANVMLMVAGGINEPRDGLTTAVWALLNHPDQLAKVVDDPTLWRPAAEESLRLVSPIGMYPREVTTPTCLGAVDLPAGARLAVVVAAANRDPALWPSPDEFDLSRATRTHLAFGRGPHYCLGAWMARGQIADTALPLLFRRLPGLRVDVDRPPVFSGWVARGALELHLKWDV